MDGERNGVFYIQKESGCDASWYRVKCIRKGSPMMKGTDSGMLTVVNVKSRLWICRDE